MSSLCVLPILTLIIPRICLLGSDTMSLSRDRIVTAYFDILMFVLQHQQQNVKRRNHKPVSSHLILYNLAAEQ